VLLKAEALDRPIVFVGGKGGVGKTTISGALALAAAERGQRVLVVSTDPAHSLADLFEVPIGGRTTRLMPGLDALEIDPDEQVDRYLATVRENLKSFVRPAMFTEIDRQIELARHSPGAVEAALLERVAGIMERASGDYDRIIFDTAPTGHTLRLLALPGIMQAWTDGLLRSRERSARLGEGLERMTARREARDDPGKGEGPAQPPVAPSGDDLSWFETPDDEPVDPRRRRIREILLERRRSFSKARRTLLDPDTTAFLLVLIPERLPILESAKALEVLRAHKVPVAGLVVNRVLPDEAGGEFMDRRREQEARYLDEIDRRFPELPRVRVPLLPGDVEGIDAVRGVAGYVFSGLPGST